MGGASWVLAASLVAVVAVVVADNVGISSCDMATDRGGSGRDLRGWGLGWRGVGRSDSWWRHSRGTGGGFEAGGQVVVVVVDVVGIIDGTDGTIARDGVASGQWAGGSGLGAGIDTNGCLTSHWLCLLAFCLPYLSFVHSPFLFTFS